ncbi:MmgE/PrpD family protein [Paracoccus sp. (in: a-proteobacteria)]|uniref:MmgE/PrpD family protein n=1 Tax=Paracoccus sp. TaxID=267 RepID=UPI002AFE9842|nr:MmgE/PrpD family protein [Paracoccus sp. (in: a-proteobacteria)]
MDAVNKVQAIDFAEEFAAWSSAFNSAAAGSDLLDAARLNLFDTLACSVAGLTAPGVPEMLGLVRDWGGKPEATVLWSDLRLPAPQAAWINGIMSHARDYDDTHDKAILHAGVSVIPASFAAAEIAGRPVTGPEFHSGVMVGLELLCRLGMATRIGLIESGFIYSSLFGYFGATAAAARILKLSPADTVNALGIAFSQAAGTHQVTRDAALTKRMQPGFAARAALTSVAMARAGIRGAQKTFEGEDGLGRIYLQSQLDGAVLRDGLGERFHFVDLAYKPYPCCRFNHTAIDAALQLREQPGFDWRKVQRIEALTNNQAYEAIGTPLAIRQVPTTVVQAQFSICYTIACALVNGQAGLADFAQEALTRPDVREVCAKVQPVVDPEIERVWGRSVGPTRIVAHCENGVFTAQVDEAKGSLATPMSASEWHRKLEDCVGFGGFGGELADRFETTVQALEQSSDVVADLRQLTARGA